MDVELYTGAHDAEPCDRLQCREAHFKHHVEADERPGAPQPRLRVRAGDSEKGSLSLRGGAQDL